MTRTSLISFILLGTASFVGCGDDSSPGTSMDGGIDAGTADAGADTGTGSFPDASVDAGTDAAADAGACQADTCGENGACATDGSDRCVCDVGFITEGLTPCTATRSCLALLEAAPDTPSGVYSIDPSGTGEPVEVYCDMETDDGGWTLVSSSTVPVDDLAQGYAPELATLAPTGPMVGVWDGMRPVVGASSDTRYACQGSVGGEFLVDLSFYGTELYDAFTTGPRDIDSCSRDRDASTRTSFARRNNLTGDRLPASDDYDGRAEDAQLRIEDRCYDERDFTVDFDDRGMDSDQNDGTDWGSDDGTPKCTGNNLGEAWFIFVRESICGNGVQDSGETGVDCGGDTCIQCVRGAGCADPEDCFAEVGPVSCTDDICEAPCENGVQDGDETDIDCGGDDCAPCRDGQSCTRIEDCATDFGAFDCISGACVAQCSNGIQDGTESDVDCGGDDCIDCTEGQSCTDDGDCAFVGRLGGDASCDGGICVYHCFNGVMDVDETDVDCGGDQCDPCGPGLGCLDDDDCTTGSDVCNLTSMTCDTTCDNGVQDGTETDVDCGGDFCQRECGNGEGCGTDDDCEFSGRDRTCDPGTSTCRVHCNNDVMDADETDVDCGGSQCDACEHGEGCAGGTDCRANNGPDDSVVCDPDSTTCDSQCDNGEQDGDETGVDCGGAVCFDRCEVGGGCSTDTDCDAPFFPPVACSPTGMCVIPCSDGAENFSETDVDCGGDRCAPCSEGQECAADSDCGSVRGPGTCSAGGLCEIDDTGVILMVALDRGYSGGEFGGISGADALCNSAATAAGSTASWRSFLIIEGQQHIDLIPAADRDKPVYNVRGELLFDDWNDVFADITEADEVIYTFAGRPVQGEVGADPDISQGRIWQGANTDGTPGLNCRQWSTSLSQLSGRISQNLSDLTPNRHRLLISNSSSCEETRGILCVSNQ